MVLVLIIKCRGWRVPFCLENSETIGMACGFERGQSERNSILKTFQLHSKIKNQSKTSQNVYFSSKCIYLTGSVLFHAMHDLYYLNILVMEAFYIFIQMYDQVESHCVSLGVLASEVNYLHGSVFLFFIFCCCSLVCLFCFIFTPHV